MPAVLLYAPACDGAEPPWIEPVRRHLSRSTTQLTILPPTPTPATDGPSWVAHTALAAAAALRGAEPPRVLVIAGPPTAWVPALEYALHAGGCPATAWVLCDGPLPSVADHDGGWPRTTVLVAAAHGSDVAHQAVLRGWVTCADPVEAIGRALGEST